MRLGFAGAGNMAAAMARGWHGADAGPAEMAFCDLDRERAGRLADEVEGERVDSLTELRDGCDALLLAVKPAALDAVAGELEGRSPPIISVMAATSLERIGAAFPGTGVLRVMPNQPVEVRRGVLCYARSGELDADLASRFAGWLAALGYAAEVDEQRIDAAMAVMSCAPAYVADFAEKLAAAGAAEGLDPELAAELVRETVAGTAELLRDRDPEAVRRAVAPPGGATEAGLQALDANGFEAAIRAAVEASLERFR